ncbi:MULTISPECIES: 2-dehydropantoate 2-reductase [unclassified Paenibacillus]|uniref:ketopantoate reductase family protein n=1 Tax=unclassified Paenibacillus TaxID=185978 RepID=UPI000953D1E8|nr:MULTISPECIES: 2-dehydropantoate 2-reductase [unclassified Paenibacillus]ASS65971.2 2-dehydropantoate 2-reductase [Paenibacillus sp. RUD330]SIQ16877.1 2-dehydropantoate 2-reductase [Paenibacillus sp. RU4X]SIQ38820.1 2-dehydropantoate 2-reductase [Paenibacillus sp. RU4T]
MKITVIGAGSIGLLYAARLSLAGEDVRALVRTRRHAEALRESGILLKTQEGEFAVPIEAAALEDAGIGNGHAYGNGNAVEPGWFILSVKQTALDAPFLGRLALLAGPQDAMLCLQNGIGHMERLSQALPNVALYAGVTSEGAMREDARTVIHTGLGELHYGAANEAASDSRSQKLRGKWQQAADKAGIAAFLSNDMENRIYRKLLLNAVINPLTALYGIRNGELPTHPQAGKLMAALHEETAAILARAGLALDGSEPARLLEVCRLTAGNVSSMLADTRAGRRSEVDSINGAVASLAGTLGLDAPLNQAAAAMVKALEP